MDYTNKNIGNAKMKDLPKKPLLFVLKERSVKTEHLDEKAVTPDKLSDDTVAYLKASLRKEIGDIQNQVNSYNEHGMSVSNEFGDNPHIGISQLTLTNAINRVWQKIEELTGEISHGITLTVDKEYFVSEDGANLHITVNPVDSTDIFERVSLYANGVLIDERDNVEDLYTVDYHIEESTLIRCEAKILGIPYEDKAFVTKYNSFWIGGGNSYLDVIQDTPIPIENGMRGHYPVAVDDGEHIIVVVGEHLANGFIRADMNGVEIAFTLEEGVEVEGKKYNVYTSVNTFNEGTYDIDVNG